MVKIMLAHPGTQHSYKTARQLKAIGYLKYFCTGFAIPDSFLGKFIVALFPFLKKRFAEKIPSENLIIYPFLELIALLRIKRGKFYEDVFYERNRKFQYLISDSYLNEVDIVICFDTTSWILAQKVKKINKKFILDVSIGHPLFKEEIFSAIKAKYPEWQDFIISKKSQYIRNELAEIELADMIVVPSTFVRDTYIQYGVPNDKIRINPFGTDINYFKFKFHSKKKPDELIFLFFGSLNARKGLPWLLKVWEKVNNNFNAQLIIAGFGSLPAQIVLPKNVKLLGKVAPQDRCALYHQADVFVFPSFFEGFAQVQIEAAACGLPLIVTYNSGGAEIVEDGKNGFIIEIEDEHSLEIAINYFLEYPEIIPEMGLISRTKAETFTWDAYGKRWEKIIDECLIQ